MKTSVSLRLVRTGSLAAVIAALIAGHSAQAAVGTWNGPGLTGTWDTTDVNWSGVTGTPWAAQGNSASFNTANNGVNVGANIAVNDWSISTSGNRVTINAGKTVEENASNATFVIFGAGHTSTADGNILTIDGTFNFGPTANSSDNFRLGSDNGSSASSYNGIIINFGGLLKRNTAGGGTHNDQVGPIAGADYNYVDINGGTFNRQGNQRFTVGVSGNYNSMTVRNGGTFTGTTSTTNNAFSGGGNRVLHIGDQGSGVAGTGSFNSVTITGAGSSGKSTQGLFIGGAANNSNNYLKIENAGTYTQAFSGSNLGQIGNSAGANNNYILVTGVGSTLNVSNATSNTRNLTIGNNATADNNHLDVFSGALADLRTAVIFGAAAATNSKFNLGNGTGISEAKVGQSTVTTGAIQLAAASARLNINHGLLTANATGDLVTGLGKIDLQGSAYVSNATGFSNTISVVIEDTMSCGVAFIKEGAGTLTLNASNTYKGATTVYGGTLVADSTLFASVISSDSALVLGRGGNFQFKGLLDTMRNQLMSGLTLEVGGNGISVDNVGSSATQTQLDLRGAWVDESTPGTLGITRHGGTVDFKAIGGTLGTNAYVMTVQPNVNGILGAWATVNDGAGLACNDGTDSIIAYAGYTDITSGTLLSSASTNYRITASSGETITPALATDVNTLTQNSDAGAGATVNNTGTLRVGSSGGILITPTGVALSIGATAGTGALTAGGGDGVPGELVLGNFSTTYSLTINSTITNNGASEVTLIKSGGGEVKLMSVSSYTGPTQVGAGTLTCETSGAIGSGPLTVSGGTLATGTFSNQTAALTLSAGAITGTGTLASTIGFALNGNSATSCSAVLANGVVASVPVSVGLVKSGPGTATLGAANTYSGETRIDAGTLAYGVADALGAGPVTVNGGTLAMGTNSDEVGAVTLTAGAITGSGTLTSTSGFTLNGSGSTYCTAILAGSGVGLVKSGTGTTTLTAANTYTGNTSIEEGTLDLRKDCLSDTSTVSIATGAVLGLNYTGTDTVKSLIIGGSPAMAGTYGSLTSTATHKSATFTGTGILNVTEGPAVQPVLTLSALPDTFVETAGPSASTGTVSIPAALGSDLVVDLVSSDPTIASVPASVTISSGATSMTFSIEAVNNLLVQSSRAATLTASSSGYINATTGVTVTEAGYANWKINNAGGQAANLDYDNDGVSNGVEFFMGATGTSFTPNPAVINGKVTWPYDANTANTGMTYQVMTSTNLVSWLPVNPQPVPAAGKLEYTLPTGNPARFVRLDVTTP